MPRLLTKLLNGHQPSGEPSLTWLPAYSPKKKQRVQRFSVALGSSRQLNIRLRRFKTSSDTRSKHVKQLVLNFRFLSFKEVAITISHRQSSKYGLRLSRNLAMALSLILIGAVGGIYSASHLKGPVQLEVNNMSPASRAVLDSHAKIPIKIGLTRASLVGADTSRHSPGQDQPKIVLPPPPKTMPRSLPTRLRIPKIEIDTSVVPVGLRPTGSLDLPDSFVEVGWYSGGPTPGELGPAVIVGHVDSTQGIAIFWRLRELAPGDTFQVDRADGTTATFKILEVEQFPQDAFPTENVYGNIRYAGIRLITCSGTFSTVTRHYDQNTVVYGTLE